MADGDTTSLFGEDGSSNGSDLFGGSLFSQPTLLSLGQSAPAQQTADTGAGMYAPKRPDYSAALKADTGVGALQNILKSLYQPDPSQVPTAAAATQAPDVTADTDTTAAAPTSTTAGDRGYQATKDYLSHGAEFVGDTEHDRMVGAATTFGLDYDTGGADPMDKGNGAFGSNTADKNIEGASLPIAVIKNSIGDYQNNPEIYNAIKRGDYKVAVTNDQGVTKVVPIVDAGPAEWTGNAIDLTYRTSHDLNTSGKAKVGYQIIGPDGDTVKIKGFHPHSVERGDWHDHIPNQGATTEEEPVKTPEKAPEEKPAKKTEAEAQPTAPAARPTTQKSLSPNTGAEGASASKTKKPKYASFNVATGNYDLQYEDGTKRSVPLDKYNASTGEILP
jgi:hypothetical protein